MDNKSLLHAPSIQRIADGKASGEHLVQLFEALAKDADLMGESVVDMVVWYIDENDSFKVGTYIPELHLTVRKVEPEHIE